MCEAAVRLIKLANYTNAGTVEFIVDQEQRFYFIEVNARIQVEHPVTEMVTGIDLIKSQIRVAAGEPLPFTQEDIQRRGAAIECRINAEDPRPQVPALPRQDRAALRTRRFGVRFDSHAHAGYVVPPHYDSMIGKLIVHQPTRHEAIACMLRALDELRVEGHHDHGHAFHKQVLSHREFAEGLVDTGFVERTWFG